MLALAADLVDDALTARRPAAAANAFRDRLRGLGPSFVQVRRYQRPHGVLTSKRHWDAGGVLVRDARPGWVGSDGFNYICLECNPLLTAVSEHRTRFRFTDLAPVSDRRFARYWDAFHGASIADAWCANAYGAYGAVASVHIGVDTADVELSIGQALQTAGSIVAEHLLLLDPPSPAAAGATLLTARERDVMRFVAEGKTDWEIGVILTVSESTARFHVDNARRKLGATNRAHAVARFVAQVGLA